ncbi:hypothetical protein B0H65DRAFT_446949 [Neurospora tetraspora]|uniref:Uncharacterized protein n=1 Tax=Neurospora tetraspora TaxID=94610 RepID=A0AAE0J199_9PEZI|nr:hypothetical protein B0H65DRAFT_446949 [Neurospora tetraspora]
MSLGTSSQQGILSPSYKPLELGVVRAPTKSNIQFDLGIYNRQFLEILEDRIPSMLGDHQGVRVFCEELEAMLIEPLGWSGFVLRTNHVFFGVVFASPNKTNVDPEAGKIATKCRKNDRNMFLVNEEDRPTVQMPKSVSLIISDVLIYTRKRLWIQQRTGHQNAKAIAASATSMETAPTTTEPAIDEEFHAMSPAKTPQPPRQETIYLSITIIQLGFRRQRYLQVMESKSRKLCGLPHPPSNAASPLRHGLELRAAAV